MNAPAAIFVTLADDPENARAGGGGDRVARRRNRREYTIFSWIQASVSAAPGRDGRSGLSFRRTWCGGGFLYWHVVARLQRSAGTPALVPRFSGLSHGSFILGEAARIERWYGLGLSATISPRSVCGRPSGDSFGLTRYALRRRARRRYLQRILAHPRRRIPQCTRPDDSRRTIGSSRSSG